MAAQRSTGKKLPELELPPVPAVAQAVWQIFAELHAERGSGFDAPNPITTAQLLQWQSLHGIRLTPWEQSAIRGIDQVFFEHVKQCAQKDQPRQSPGA